MTTAYASKLVVNDANELIGPVQLSNVERWQDAPALDLTGCVQPTTSPSTNKIPNPHLKYQWRR
ncbi:MAG: hypothetical protein FJ146_17960 [Deltaproteobacteria bacterium]|nr:hypothetical protein [Deltaproteobacteria bacterium]